MNIFVRIFKNKNAKNRKLRCLLYAFIITLFMFTTIVLHGVLITYTTTVDKSKTTILQFDGREPSPQILESSILNATSSTPTLIWNKIAMSRLPWYFKGGTLLPNGHKVFSDTEVRVSQVWPKDRIDSDRVEEQLMFVPSKYQYENAPIKKILLYGNFKSWMVEEGISEFLSNDCPVNRCTITSKIKTFPNMDAIIFREKYTNPGYKKSGKQIWILFSMESAYYTKLNVPKNVINWTATYRHDSDIVIPYGRWAYYDPTVTQVEQSNQNYARNKSKQVAMIVTNCHADNGRLLYARELSKYISVDVYGNCGDIKMNESNNDFLQMLDRDYKFYLAFENSNCVDYVTEKFFIDGLQHNTLPIVMGGRREDYERMAPRQSYLHVDDYESPERLAEYLRRLDADDDAYNEYFRWKGTGEFIDTKFFCRLCAMLHAGSVPVKYYRNFNAWWNVQGMCNNTMKWIQEKPSP